MFESYDDIVREDERAQETPKQKLLKWMLVGIVSIVLFGGLYMGVRLLE